MGAGSVQRRNAPGAGGFGPNVSHAAKPEVANLVQSLGGRRAPGFPKIAEARGNIVERGPPYRTEVQPTEYSGPMIKVGYGTRYGDCGVAEYV